MSTLRWKKFGPSLETYELKLFTLTIVLLTSISFYKGSRKLYLNFQFQASFFTPIPCTYSSLPLDGMARNYYFYLHGYARSRNLSCLDPFSSNLLIPKEKKNIWSELESNPGPLASQATALTTRPWLLGQQACFLLSSLRARESVRSISTEVKISFKLFFVYLGRPFFFLASFRPLIRLKVYLNQS